MNAPLHFLPTTLPTDDLLVLDVHRRLQVYTEDSRDPSLVIYLIKGNGGGRRLCTGHLPPADHEQAAIKLVRALNMALQGHTRCSWLVALAGWTVGADGVGRYQQTFMFPKDGDGDSPVIIDTTDTPAEIEASIGKFIFDCADAWTEYLVHLEAVGVTAEHMVARAQNLDKVWDPILPDPSPPPRRPRHEPKASRAAARRPSAFPAPSSVPSSVNEGRIADGKPAPSVSPTHGTP
jgi:hypothetical protein